MKQFSVGEKVRVYGIAIRCARQPFAENTEIFDGPSAYGYPGKCVIETIAGNDVYLQDQNKQRWMAHHKQLRKLRPKKKRVKDMHVGYEYLYVVRSPDKACPNLFWEERDIPIEYQKLPRKQIRVEVCRREVEE